ncbi:MAG: Ig-like domain-containing protein [Bacteroidales bacterium]|nr:Ig-like domain-containing protein [Bacteroidales bacterium]
MKRVFYALMFLLVMSLAGCQKEPETIKVSAVVLNSTSLSLIEGETATLSATVTPSNAENKTVHWSTSNSDVATVNNGTVTAERSGVATITAISDDGGKTAECVVTVKEKVYPVESVTLDKTEVELTEGDELTLTATVKPDNATNKGVEWSSSDEKVATVKDGKVTAVKAGSAKITVKTIDGGKTASCSIDVSEKVIHVSELTISKDFLLLKTGNSHQLSVDITPQDATNKKVSWDSSNPKIASVSEGNIEILDVGYTVISVTSEDGNITASCEVLSYSMDPVDLGLSFKWSSINIDAQTPLEYGGYYSWGEVKEKSSYSWENYKYCNGTEYYMTKYCSEPKYGDADYKSVLEKEDDISWAKLGDGWRTPTEDECDELLENTVMEEKTFDGIAGYLLTAKNGRSIFFPKADNPHCVYYSWTKEYGWYLTSTLCLGESSEYCSILTLRGGGADWSYTGGAERASGYSVRPIYGGEPIMPLLGLNLSDSKITLSPGKSKTLSVDYLPENATNKSVAWSSDDQGIATVNNGVVTAKSVGSTTITVKSNFDNRIYTTCKIVVESNSVTGISVKPTSLTLIEGSSETLQVTISPSSAINKNVIWSSNNPNVATVSNGVVKAVKKGDATITAKSEDGGYTASCQVKVISVDDFKGYHNNREYIDLGLSVKWATYNLGGNESNPKGRYYLWGDYSNSGTIPFYNPPYRTNICGTSYDSATYAWGEGWRMPTMQEIRELVNNCDLEPTTVGGLRGIKVTGLNGASIFLPATGYEMPADGPIGSKEYYDTSSGYYMSGEANCNSGGTFFKHCVFGSDGSTSMSTTYNAMFVKMVIRPVCEN